MASLSETLGYIPKGALYKIRGERNGVLEKTNVNGEEHTSHSVKKLTVSLYISLTVAIVQSTVAVELLPHLRSKFSMSEMDV